jgi:hypothetical protein
MADNWVDKGIAKIEGDYGVKIQDGRRTLRKFGRGSLVTKSARYTVMTQGSTAVANETLTTANLVDSVIASTTATQTLGVEGYTVDSSGDLTHVTQDVTLTSSTAAALGTALNTVTRMYVKERTFANPSSDCAAIVYAYESTNTGVSGGAPSSQAYTKAIMSSGVNQTEKCATCTEQKEYAIIRSVCAALPEGASPTGTAAADINLEIKRKGGVFRPIGLELSVGAQQRTAVVEFDPPEIVPPNSYFRLVGYGSTTDLVVTGAINGVYVKEQGT